MGLSRNRRIFLTLCIVVQILLVSFGAIPVISANVTKKLDQELVHQMPDTGIECGSCPCVNPCGSCPCPCVNPCGQHPPPPPPPEATCCPPQVQVQVQTPPPPRFVYITGEPGEIYHTEADEGYSTAQRKVAKNLLLLAGCGVLWLLII